MSEEIMTSAADLTTMIGLRAENDGLRQRMMQAERARDAERAARRMAEADNAVLQLALGGVTRRLEQEPLASAWMLNYIAANRATLAEDHPGQALLSELEAARAVIAAARTGFGTEEDIRRAWAFDPNLLTATIRAYDETTKARSE